MNKLIFIDLSILETYNIVMYYSWYDFLKPKYEEKPKIMLCGYW